MRCILRTIEQVRWAARILIIWTAELKCLYFSALFDFTVEVELAESGLLNSRDIYILYTGPVKY